MFRIVQSSSFVVSWSSVRYDGGEPHESSWPSLQEAEGWLSQGPYAADPTFIASETEERLQYAVESDDGVLQRTFHYSSDVYEDRWDLPLYVYGEESLSAARGYVESGDAFRDWKDLRRVDRLQAVLRQPTMYFVSEAWVSRERAAEMQFALGGDVLPLGWGIDGGVPVWSVSKAVLTGRGSYVMVTADDPVVASGFFSRAEAEQTADSLNEAASHAHWGRMARFVVAPDDEVFLQEQEGPCSVCMGCCCGCCLSCACCAEEAEAVEWSLAEMESTLFVLMEAGLLSRTYRISGPHGGAQTPLEVWDQSAEDWTDVAYVCGEDSLLETLIEGEGHPWT